jgi:hypothetical protein
LIYERDTKVAEDDNSDDYKVTLAQQIFGRAAVISGRNPPEPRTNDAAKTPPVAARDYPEASPASLEPGEAQAQQRQFKTAAELAELIESDLARHPDCPKRGFRVTVYGGSHWRAMLTITPAAGPGSGETSPTTSLSDSANTTIWPGNKPVLPLRRTQAAST